MSFFDLPETQKYFEGGLHEAEDVAVYTWGEESYDGLGDVLQEGGDDLNDETFGGTGPIGRDFDFQNQTWDTEQSGEAVAAIKESRSRLNQVPDSSNTKLFETEELVGVNNLWNVKSPFSVLPRAHGASRFSGPTKGTSAAADPAPSSANPIPNAGAGSHTRVRTVQEIEEEMKAAAQHHRDRLSPSLSHAPSHSILPSQSSVDIGSVERQMRAHQISHLPTSSPRQTFQPPQQHIMARSSHERQLSNTTLDSQLPPMHQSHNQPLMSQSLVDRVYKQQLSVLQQQQAHMQQNTPATGDVNELLQVHQLQQAFTLTMEQQELMRQKAAQQIMEQEVLEVKRRRKAMKISRISRNNDLMTQSDKDFITRIQISQLMMSDPYEEDFYNQVYQTLVRKRIASQSNVSFSSKNVKGDGTQFGGRSGRRQNAMQRMEAQVERIINSVRSREKEKDLHSVHHLQGVLGKTSGRSYKAAPRQLLQVDSITGHDVPNDEKAEPAHSLQTHSNSFGDAIGIPLANGQPLKEPLTPKHALVLLEKLYDLLLQTEHMRREQPAANDQEGAAAWFALRSEKINHMFDALPVHTVPDISVPHPMISLLVPSKGKKIIPRIVRQLEKAQQLELLLAILQNISQLDIISVAFILDGPEETLQRKELERQTQLFMNNVINGFLPLLMELNLAPINHILSVLITRADVPRFAKSRPGIALLTALMTQVANIKHAITVQTDNGGPTPLEDLAIWQEVYDQWFHLLASHLLALFPSTRMAMNLPFGTEYYLKPSPLTDAIDQPVWNFFAAFAVHASVEQQQILVTVLRDKVLENVISANKNWDTEESARRVANVDLFLNALGLDSSQIAL